MDETYRLLRECLWYLEAQDDPDYSPHLLQLQKDRLCRQLSTRLDALEADQLWSQAIDDEVTTVVSNSVPSGWEARVLEPTRTMRFTAKSPPLSGHCCLVIADSSESLHNWTQVYDVVFHSPD